MKSVRQQSHGTGEFQDVKSSGKNTE